jgi:hypothetical protein
MITRRIVAEKLTAYLQHSLPLPALVHRAEMALMESNFDVSDINVTRNIVARIGVADVRAFGLTWDECEEMLKNPGYTVHLQIEAA